MLHSTYAIAMLKPISNKKSISVVDIAMTVKKLEYDEL